jgi:trehalose utilization protein
MPTTPLRVTVWNEFVHEQTHDAVKQIYPQGIHFTIADALRTHLGTRATVRTATLEEPEHGLTEQVLAETDVLTWWGHAAHDKVSDEVAARVQRRVWEGMGLVVLHSAHLSKPFTRLMGTPCMLRWRDAGERERLWIVDPSHPIAAGLTGEFFELERDEMYGEQFSIPAPEELIFISWFEGGEVFRSGCTFRRGAGKIFYFRPGHEMFPTYHDANVQQVIANGVEWVATQGSTFRGEGREIQTSLSPLQSQRAKDESLHE